MYYKKVNYHTKFLEKVNNKYLTLFAEYGQLPIFIFQMLFYFLEYQTLGDFMLVVYMLVYFPNVFDTNKYLYIFRQILYPLSFIILTILYYYL